MKVYRSTVNNPKCSSISLIIFLVGAVPMLYGMTGFSKTFWAFEDIDTFIQANPYCTQNSSNSIKAQQYKKYRCEDDHCNKLFINNIQFTGDDLQGKTYCIPYKNSVGNVVNPKDILALLSCTDIAVNLGSGLQVLPFSACYNTHEINTALLFSHIDGSLIVLIAFFMCWTLLCIFFWCICMDSEKNTELGDV
jgi:hypothetical protein